MAKQIKPKPLRDGGYAPVEEREITFAASAAELGSYPGENPVRTYLRLRLRDRHFQPPRQPEELHEITNAEVIAETLVRKAVADLSTAIFVIEQTEGKAVQRVENTGAGGRPIEINLTRDRLRELSDAELALMAHGFDQ